MVVVYRKASGLVGIDFFCFASVRVGNCKRIWFWHDVWCGD